MAREITAGVLLKLKDQFSSQIKGAGISVQGFADKAVGMAEKVNTAFSGVAGTLGTLGVGIGTAALIKGGIDYQNAIVRIATNAGVYGREVNEFGRRLIQIAYDAKVSHQELIAFANTASECAVGLEDITSNMPFMADVIQALGISGEEAGQLFTTLFKRGVDADALKEKLNNLAEIGNRLGNMSITQFAKFLPSLSETSGAALDNIEDLYIALNMLAKGTNKPQQALQQYQSSMDDFKKSADSIRRYTGGFNVLNEDTGELKGFAEIMEALSKFGEQTGATAYFDKVFGLSDSTIKALRQYNNYYQETIENVGELGDTSKAIAKRAGQNAGTIEASLIRLKSAASDFASSTLIKPVEKLADLLSQHPQGMEYAVKGLAAAIAAIALMKSFSAVVSFIGNLKTLKDGGGVAGGFNVGGGAGIPVHVTNWGGAAGSSMIPGAGNGIPVPRTGAARGAASLLAKASPYLAFAAGTIALSKLIDRKGTEKYSTGGRHYSEWEHQAKGAVQSGDRESELEARIAALNIQIPEYEKLRAGFDPEEMFEHWDAAGGSRMVTLDGLRDELQALRAEAAVYNTSPALPPVGSPGVSRTNIVYGPGGHQVDDLIVTPQGQFSTHPKDFIFAMQDPASLVNNEIHNEVRTVQFIPQATPPVVVEGEIELKSELVIDDRGYRLRQQVGKNTTPYKFAIGNARNARLIQ
jgi:hypothetical protein